ncbi:PREDICTED: uncharacterized protein LOC104604531 [Nelumbo nucifera]|uniref:Uncharacterized protein LOC104604531 n=1 Tax=Nelumbo nucifera TaxID=4432 RepID=A0A1U8Q9X3_NELNU|nr:PREDICTED: uncharacterized protein LOC104604531 [Nelumbo nucifera]
MAEEGAASGDNGVACGWRDYRVFEARAKLHEKPESKMALLSLLNQIAGTESSLIVEAFKPEFYKLVLGTLSLPINLPGTNYKRGFQVIVIILKNTPLTFIITSDAGTSTCTSSDRISHCPSDTGTGISAPASITRGWKWTTNVSRGLKRASHNGWFAGSEQRLGHQHRLGLKRIQSPLSS